MSIDDANNRLYFIKEISENSEEAKHPKDWNLRLKNHQLALIHKCINLENNGVEYLDDNHLKSRYNVIKSNIGIIADKVGSGKSYSLLGIIDSNPTPLIKFKQTHMYGHNNINVEVKNRLDEYTKLDVNIIVVPHSLIKQWEDVIINCSKKFTYYVVNTTKSLNFLDAQLKKVKIIIVSGTFYRKIQEHITNEEYIVSRVIFDEVDSMNTPNAKHLNANFYWFVSASYRNILNPYPKWTYEYMNWETTHMVTSGISNNVYAKSIFMHFYKNKNITLNRLIDKIVIKNLDSFVDNSFQLPELQRNIIKCKDSCIISILDGVVHSTIINCLNAGDIPGALAQINQDNIDTEMNIINAVKQSLEIKLLNINVELRIVIETIYINDENKRKRILKLETEKNIISNKISLIEDRINSSELCTICLEIQKTKTITKCCNNSFCLKCLTAWIDRNPTCPLCKAVICVKKDIFIVAEQNLLEIPIIPLYLSKLERLYEMLSNKTIDSKILIFSEFEQSFFDIEEILNKLKIKYAKLKGNGINKSVFQYKNADTQVLLVNSHAYGSGLNLENTTDVILFHKFDTDIETQIIGRAQRPGRKDALKVWYLLNQNELQ
jgi:SNF2 family DNA or RNA helicase